MQLVKFSRPVYNNLEQNITLSIHKKIVSKIVYHVFLKFKTELPVIPNSAKIT